jgi:beta-lactamase regulating signal transducer with metallopeptidase domain
LRPSIAVRLLTVLALTVALCTGLILSAAAVLASAQWGPLPRFGQWSAPELRHHMGFPVAAGVIALIVVALCLGAAIVRATLSLRALLSAARVARSLEPAAGDLVFVQDETPVAYSVAGRRGRIVVSTSMLTALSAGERRVLIAHEASHLRHQHQLYLHLAHLAAAANPLLRPTAGAIQSAIERWADEDAAAEVGDRQLAARALARAALARSGHPPLRHVLAAADDRIAARVQLLLAPPQPMNWPPVVLIVAAALLSWTAAAAMTIWANDLIQLAESVYPHR